MADKKLEDTVGGTGVEAEKQTKTEDKMAEKKMEGTSGAKVDQPKKPPAEEMAPLSDEWLQKAQAGEEEYQVKVGQHYLTLADSSVDREKNAAAAIHWLTRASMQGNDEATKLLKKCLENQTGITDENREDVKWCVTTSSLEKKIRSAARNMFTSINSAHKEVLSPDEYQEAIKKLTGGKEQQLLLAAGKKIGQNISENEFVKLVSRKVQGQVTLTSREHSDAYETASPIEKVLKYPKETAMAVGDQVLEVASRDGLGIVMGCVPVDQIYYLMLFFMYGLLTTTILLFVIPLLVFYISFATIIITTLQMFYKKKKLKEASALAEMLKQYDVGVDVNQTQSQYSWNSLTPYIVYFTAIPVVVVSFSLADKTYIPCSEFSIMCCIMCGVCFMAISDSHDLVTLLALFCSFLAALPTLFVNFPQVPVISSLINVLSGSFLSIDLFGGIQVNIGIPAICYLIIPVFFIQMAARNSFSGMYRVLVPHLVCYFWFNLATTMYPFTTWFGIARATVGYILLPILIPLSMFFVILGLIYMVVKLSSSDMFGKIIITLLLACIPILLSQTKKLFGGKLDDNKKFRHIKKALMVVFAALAIIPLIFVRLPSGTSEKAAVTLSLSEYMTMCHPKDSSHIAGLQIKCGQLAGSKVVWNGLFLHAKVTGVTNDITKMIDVFPSFVGKPLTCIYGQYYDCEDEGMSKADIAFCKLMIKLGKDCHVKEHDSFNFNFAMSVTENDLSLTPSVDAGNGFKETLLALKQSDEIEIRGTLVGGLGTSSPSLKVKEIKCTSRELDVMRNVEVDSDEVYQEVLDQSLKVAFNFFWYPLMEYVPLANSEEPAVAE